MESSPLIHQPHLDQVPGEYQPSAVKRPSSHVINDTCSRVGSIFRSIIQNVSAIWEKIKMPIDPPWRKTEKYRHILGGIGQGTALLIKESTLLPENKAKCIAMIEASKGETPARPPGCNKGSRAELDYLTKKALYILFSSEGFNTERDRYKAFMFAFKAALESDYYLARVGNKSSAEIVETENNNPSIALLHTMALAEFTCVNTQTFTQSVAEQIATAGGYKAGEVKGTPEEMVKQSLGNLTPFTDAIGEADADYKICKLNAYASSLKGEIVPAEMWGPGLDPLITGGNPANVKFRLKVGERNVIALRLPSPTIGPQVSPMFHAYLRALKARGEKHAYISLQDRRSPKQQPTLKKRITAAIGFPREDRRVRQLEALNKGEFKDVIQVFTLDKNSDFYWQKSSRKGAEKLLDNLIKRKFIKSPQQIKQLKKDLKRNPTFPGVVDNLINLYQLRSDNAEAKLVQMGVLQPKDQFVAEFKDRLFNTSGSFHFPAGFARKHETKINEIIDQTGRTVFSGKESLSPMERQDYIEIVYALLTSFILVETGATNFNTSCKDCIDRGAGQSAMSLYMFLLYDIRNHPVPEGQDDPRLELLKDLPAKATEDAIWARKRAILSEREERLKSALSRIADHSTPFYTMMDTIWGSDAPQVDIPADPLQKVVLERPRRFRKLEGESRSISRAF